MSEENLPYSLQSGFMTDTDIKNAIKKNEMFITSYDEKNNLTPVGYNFSFSNFIVSLNKKMFIEIKKDKSTDELYFYLNPNDTVLILTTEAIWVSKNIGGTFHSKVSMVTLGLGHVSTTLDPGWFGQLLVPMNNPTKRKIKVVIGIEGTEIDSGKPKYYTFITLVLYRALSKASCSPDNKPARYELLNKIINNGKNNKQRQSLIDVIKKIKSRLTNDNEEVINLINNASKSEMEEIIPKLESMQKSINDALNDTYQEIKRSNKQLIINNTIKFIFYSLVLLIFLVILSIFGGNIIQTVMPILIAFCVLYLTYIKDNYL